MKKIIVLSLLLSGCNLTGLQVAGAIAGGYQDAKGSQSLLELDGRCMQKAHMARQQVINNQLIAGVKYVDYSRAGQMFQLTYKSCMGGY